MRAEEAVRVLESSELFWLRPTADEMTALNMAIEALKTAKHGHFNAWYHGFGNPLTYSCSVCGFHNSADTLYCPHCGAKMDEEVQP